MASDHSQDQLAKALVDEIVQTLMEEHDQLIDESIRLQAILTEAAEVLRVNFKTVDMAVRENGVSSSDYREAYQQIVAALQFEDIVSQIISHHMERTRVSQTILGRINEVLERALDKKESDSMLGDLRADISARLSSFASSSSVMQENLTVGESELF